MRGERISSYSCIYNQIARLGQFQCAELFWRLRALAQGLQRD